MPVNDLLCTVAFAVLIFGLLKPCHRTRTLLATTTHEIITHTPKWKRTNMREKNCKQVNIWAQVCEHRNNTEQAADIDRAYAHTQSWHTGSVFLTQCETETYDERNTMWINHEERCTGADGLMVCIGFYIDRLSDDMPLSLTIALIVVQNFCFAIQRLRSLFLHILPAAAKQKKVFFQLLTAL